MVLCKTNIRTGKRNRNSHIMSLRTSNTEFFHSLLLEKSTWCPIDWSFSGFLMDLPLQFPKHSIFRNFLLNFSPIPRHTWIFVAYISWPVATVARYTVHNIKLYNLDKSQRQGSFNNYTISFIGMIRGNGQRTTESHTATAIFFNYQNACFWKFPLEHTIYAELWACIEIQNNRSKLENSTFGRR